MEDQKMEKIRLSNNTLEEVTGGRIFNGALSGNNMILSNMSHYSSGAEPKYQVGQILTIQYLIDGYKKVDCTCCVTAVSATREEGWLCPEFGYTVEITDAPQEVLDIEPVLNRIYTRVYESCLYAR